MLKIQGRHDVTSIKKVKGGTIRIQDLETKAIIGLNMDRVKPSCFFEDHYFKRPENAGSYRRRCGRCLAKEHPPPPGKNVVIAPVPQSGNSYAHGYSHKSRVHIEEILLRSPLSKEVRAFIASQDPVLRGEQALLKFIVAAGDCKGKKIVIVDDSLVEGNVSMKVNYLLRRAGALEVHGRSGCPPIVGPCRGGIDIPEDRPLVRKLGFNPHAVVESHTLLEERLKCVEDPKLGTIKFDSFGYLSIESLKKCLGGGSYCTGCVTLEYPYMFKDMEKCGAKFVPVKPRKKTEDKSVPKE
jgi:amidophosphoribosyltransferase